MAEDLILFDPLGPDFVSTANSQFAAMRKEVPIYRHGSATWPLVSVFRFSDIRKVLSEPKVWSSDMPAVAGLVLGDASVLIQDDPPTHTHHRAAISPFMATLATESHRAYVTSLVERIFRESVGVEIDFVEQIAARVSIDVICNLLGIPAAEHTYLREWTNRFSDNVGLEFLETDEGRLDDQRVRVSALHTELTEYLRDVRIKILHQEDDSIIHILSKSDLTVPEQVGMIKSLVFAGNHSSTILQANAAWLFADNPEQFRLLKSNTSLADTAVEEILRYKGTFRGLTRVATCNGEICNTPFNKGEYLIVWLASANWDDSVFESPQIFDITRSPNRHLGFGHGPHHCIGAQLARTELKAMVRILARFRTIQIVGSPRTISDPWVDGFEELRLILHE